MIKVRSCTSYKEGAHVVYISMGGENFSHLFEVHITIDRGTSQQHASVPTLAVTDAE